MKIIIFTIIVIALLIAYVSYVYLSFLNEKDERELEREYLRHQADQSKKADEDFRKLPRHVRRKLVRGNLKKQSNVGTAKS